MSELYIQTISPDHPRHMAIHIQGAVEIADYIIENSATVRQTAKQFRISKSTVHKDVTERLLQINPSLAQEARKVLDMNKSERHIRGGMATREKYLHQHLRQM